MQIEQLQVDVHVDIRKNSTQNVGVTLMSQDINNYSFYLRVLQDGELLAMDDTYEVEVLSVFTTSKSRLLTKGTIKSHYVDWVFDTAYISKSEVVKNYVYVRKNGVLLVSADANCFIFSVGLSAIDSDVGRVAEVYDENYEKVLLDYSDALDDRTTARLDDAVGDFNQRGDAEIVDWREYADVELEDYLADRVVLKNLVVNGDFSNGLDSWDLTSVITSGSAVSDGKLHVYGENSGSTNTWPTVRQDSKTVGGHAYYFYLEISDMSENSTPVTLQDRNTVIMEGVRNGTHSKIVTAKDGQALTKIYLNHTILPNGFVDYKVDNLIVIDLSETFGAGNEPSKEWMDRLVEQTGYFDEHILNESWQVGEILRLDDTKANKVQEDWITPTLLGGWENFGSSYSNLQYMKDSLGFVHIQGQIKNGATSHLFTLPVGYRPSQHLSFPILANTSMGVGSNINASTGNLNIMNYNATRTIIDLIFLAEK